ncbi:MAG: hypothetical protein OTJ44_00675 [Planctomycetota bacterium]|nr:hypothetical protein [Planctomycetota bacterium]
MTQVSALPFDVRPGEVQENLRVVLETLESLPDVVQLLLLPEKWTTSFLPAFSSNLRQQSEEALRVVHQAAEKRGLVVVGSAPGGDEEKPFNEIHFLGIAGSHRPYRKRLLFSPTGEGRQIARGTAHPQVVETPLGSMMAVVCYDLRFPEVTRHAFYQEADFLLVPAQWPTPRAKLFDLLVKARAAENQQWVLACNRAGSAPLGEQLLDFPGTAWLVNPSGQVHAEVGKDGVLRGEVKMSQIEAIRKQIPCARDLKQAKLWPEISSPQG